MPISSGAQGTLGLHRRLTAMNRNILHMAERTGPWDKREQETLARIHDACVNNGMPIEIENGISDEGAPWATFYDQRDGSFVAHITRDKRRYVLICSDEKVEYSPSLERFVSVVPHRCRPHDTQSHVWAR